jgi:hypothetical protein
MPITCRYALNRRYLLGKVLKKGPISREALSLTLSQRERERKGRSHPPLPLGEGTQGMVAFPLSLWERELKGRSHSPSPSGRGNSRDGRIPPLPLGEGRGEGIQPEGKACSPFTSPSHLGLPAQALQAVE